MVSRIALLLAACLCSAGAVAANKPVSIRLISAQQYANTIRDVFGLPFQSRRFAPVRRVEGLVTVGSGTAVVTAGALDLLDVAAREVAAQVVALENRHALIPCKPQDATLADDACAAQFFTRAGRALLRRSLAPEEVAGYVALARQGALESKSFYTGIATGLASLLVDPEFLYFVMSAEPDPDRPGQYRLDGRSKAMRLSLLMWNTAPDEALLQAAERGELHTRAGLKRQVERMAKSPRLQDGVRAFFDDMLVLEKFDNLAKDGTIYPAYTLKVRDDAREQALRTIVDHVVVRDQDYRDLFESRRTFLTPELAVLYGVSIPAAGSHDWVPYEFPPDDPRAGLLTQIAFLSAYSHPGRTSPTQRGRALREAFMCQKVQDPPGNVDFSLIEDPNAVFHTARERLAAHNNEPTCAGCHKVTDPIGLTLEHFDGAGQFRLKEGGVLIDTTGELDGVEYSDARGLAKAVRNNPAVVSCLVSRVYQYGLARPVTKEDEPTLARIGRQFAADGYRFVALMKSLALDEAFFAVDSKQVEGVAAGDDIVAATK